MSGEEKPDAYYVGRLLGRLKLVIATDDEIPIETKLDTQAMIKEFSRHLMVEPSDQDIGILQSQYDHLMDSLDEYPNCESLLLALRNFAPNL